MLSIFVKENRTKDFYLFICNIFGRLATVTIEAKTMKCGASKANLTGRQFSIVHS